MDQSFVEYNEDDPIPTNFEWEFVEVPTLKTVEDTNFRLDQIGEKENIDDLES